MWKYYLSSMKDSSCKAKYIVVEHETEQVWVDQSFELCVRVRACVCERVWACIETSVA